MHLDLDTFLVSVYYSVDLLYQRFFRQYKPHTHHLCLMPDSYIITLFVVAQWSSHRSEARILSYAQKHWTPYFGYILSQSSFNKRVRNLAGVICHMVPLLRKEFISWLALQEDYQILDGVAAPVMELCRANKSSLFADCAEVGKGGSGRKFYYGFKILEAIDNLGFITGFVIGPANTEERSLAEALLRWRVDPDAAEPSGPEINNILGKTHNKGKKEERRGPTGPLTSCGAGYHSSLTYITDLGFKSEKWEKHWQENYRSTLLNNSLYRNLPEKERRKRSKWLSKTRQDIETVFAWQILELHLKSNKARSYGGFIARTGAKLLAFNFMIGMNHQRGKPKFELSEYNAVEMR